MATTTKSKPETSTKGEKVEFSKETYLFEDKIDSWTNDLTKIKVEFLGEAKEGLKRGIIVASFNAG